MPNNQYFSVNFDLQSDARVLPNAPLVGYDDDFSTMGMKAFDLVKVKLLLSTIRIHYPYCIGIVMKKKSFDSITLFKTIKGGFDDLSCSDIKVSYHSNSTATTYKYNEDLTYNQKKQLNR